MTWNPGTSVTPYATGTLPVQGGGLSDLEVQFGNVTAAAWVGRMVMFRPSTATYFCATIVAVNTTTDIVTLDRLKPPNDIRLSAVLASGDAWYISDDAEEVENGGSGNFSEESNAQQRAYRLNQKMDPLNGNNCMLAFPGRLIRCPAGTNETTTTGDGSWDFDNATGNQILAMSGGQFNNELGGSSAINDYHFIEFGNDAMIHFDNTSMHSIQRTEININSGARLHWDNVQNIGNTKITFNGHCYIRNSFMEGRELATDIILFNHDNSTYETVFGGTVLKNTNGLDTQVNSTTAKFYLVFGSTFLNPSPRNFNIQAFTGWYVVDCIYDRNSTTINFVTNNNNALYDFTQLGIAVVDLGGQGITDARSYVCETTYFDIIVNEADSPVGGAIIFNILRELYTYPASVFTQTLYDGHILKTGKHGYSPNLIGLSFPRTTQATSSVISLATDVNITETNPATALTNGAGITLTAHKTGETDPNPMILLHYDGGTGTRGPIVGDTLTSGTSTGTVLDVIPDGDAAVAGWIVIESWNGVAFTNNTAISNGLVAPNDFDALTDISGGAKSTYVSYVWEIDGNALSLDTIYDWLSAKAWQAVATVDATMDAMINWFETSNGGHFLATADGETFWTNRALTRLEGVWIHNYGGGGSVSYQTSDSGAQFFPPSTVTVQVEVLDDSTGSPIQGANVQLYLTSDYTTVVMSTTTNASGIASVQYQYTTDQGVEGWAREMDLAGQDYEQNNIAGTITANGLSIQTRLRRISV